jgi:branched-chain amino acid transport system permease protein
LITAIGASFAISEAVGDRGIPFLENKHREQYSLTKFFKKEQLFKIFGADVYDSNVIVIVGVAVMAITLVLFVDKTRVGRGIRAVAQDAETAKLMGVDVDKIILITFLVGGLMAGGAAFLYEIHLPSARYNIGFSIGVKAFTAAVLGGIGNVRGALLGGVLLGLIENWGTSLFGADQNVGNIGAFVTLVLVLMFRPSGLLGESLGRSKA